MEKEKASEEPKLVGPTPFEQTEALFIMSVERLALQVNASVGVASGLTEAFKNIRDLFNAYQQRVGMILRENEKMKAEIAKLSQGKEPVKA